MTRRAALSAACLGLAALLLAGCAGTPAPPTPTEGDRRALAEATNEALEHSRTGESRNWANPASGHNGTVTPMATRERAGAQPCREFQQTFTAGGTTQLAYGTACRSGPGDWRTTEHSGFFAPDGRRSQARYRGRYHDPYYRDPFYDPFYDPYWGPGPHYYGHHHYGYGRGPRSGVSFGVIQSF